MFSQSNNIIDILKMQISYFGPLDEDELTDLNNYSGVAKQLTQEALELYVGIPKTFNFLQTHHSGVFLYKLARLLYENGRESNLCTKLYLLNRMLNGVDLYYKIKMPKFFLLGHGLGTIFSNATYGDYLVVFQNVTIAVQDSIYPKIGDKVVIYPGSVISGNTIIGHNSVVGAGTILVNKEIPENSVVYSKSGRLKIKPNCKNIISKYFNVPA